MKIMIPELFAEDVLQVWPSESIYLKIEVKVLHNL